MWTVIRQLAPWRRTTVKQYHDQRSPVKGEAKMCERRSYLGCIRRGWRWAFARRHRRNEKSVGVKQGEVTEIDEPDRAVVGGVGEW